MFFRFLGELILNKQFQINFIFKYHYWSFCCASYLRFRIAARRSLKRVTHCFLVFPGTKSAIWDQRSFFSIVFGNFLSAYSNEIYYSWLQASEFTSLLLIFCSSLLFED